MYWNPILRFHIESYMDSLVNVLLNASMFRTFKQHGAETGDIIDMVFDVYFAFVVIALPIFLIWKLVVKEPISDRRFERKYSVLVSTLDIAKKGTTAAFIPLFLLRRAAFVAIMFALREQVVFAVFLLILKQLAYLLYFCTMRPFLFVEDMRGEAFNEATIYFIYC